MNPLMIISDEGALTMTSREIAELTGKRHDNVMRDARAMLFELHGVGGVLKFEDTHVNPQNGETYLMFRLPWDETTCLLTGYDTKARMAVIRRWRELEMRRAKPEPAVPQNFAQALYLAAEQQERIEAQQLELKQAAPKVVYADAMLASDGTTLIREAAKVLGVPPKKLFGALKDKKVLLSNNAPAAFYVGKGYFKESVHAFATNTRGEAIGHTARVTTRGLEFLRRFVDKHLSGYKHQPMRS